VDTKVIDVTGLPAPVIQDLERLVKTLREQSQGRHQSAPSIFDLFGKAPVLRSGEDIAAQLREERDAWGEP
jgi:hypothetical protein